MGSVSYTYMMYFRLYFFIFLITTITKHVSNLGHFGLRNEELILSLHRLKYSFLCSFFFLFILLLHNIFIVVINESTSTHSNNSTIIWFNNIVSLILVIFLLVVFERILGLLCDEKLF